MRTTSNWFENLLGRILFAAFWLPVLFPLVHFFFRLFVFENLASKIILIFGLATLVGGAVLSVSQKISNTFWAKVFLLGGFVAADLLLVRMGNFSTTIPEESILSPYLLAFIAMFFFLSLAFRYEKLVNGEIEFMSDFSSAGILMILILIFKGALKIPVSHYQTLCFFAAGAALGIYRKFNDIKDGTGKSRRSWLVVTLLVIGFMIIFAVIITFGFSTATLDVLIYPLYLLLELVKKVLFTLMMYVLIMLEPLVNMVIGFLRGQMAEEEFQKINEGMGKLAQQFEGFGQTRPVDDYSWVLRTLIILAVIVVVIVVIARYRRDKGNAAGYEEERESVFSTAEMKEDFLNLLKSFTDRFRREKNKAESIYDGSSYALKIREVYYRFLKTLHPQIPFQKFFTPREYSREVGAALPARPVQKLTSIYEKARYGGEVGEAELTEMKEAFREVRSGSDEETSDGSVLNK